MISEDLRFEGFDSRSWTNLISLFAPQVVSRMALEDTTRDGADIDVEQASDTHAGVLYVVLDDRDRVLKAFHGTKGRITGLEYPGPEGLADLARAYGAIRCVVLREGVMEEIAERVARRMGRGEDYIAQWLILARAMREMSEAGLLLTWPRPLAAVPIPTIGMVRRALDTLLPDGHAMVLVVWQGATPWTGMVLRRRAGVIDWIAGPDLILRWAGPLGGDWRRDYRVISEAVTRQVAPVHLGIFTDVTMLKRLLRAYDPGAWAAAAAVRDVIVHPAPPYIAVALGADVVRAAAQQSVRWLGGIDALAPLAPLAGLVRGRVAEIASVSQTLGFDPLAALSAWLRRAESVEEPDAAPEG